MDNYKYIFFNLLALSLVNLFQNLTDSDANFITEVFSGCARYGSIMKVVTKTFYVQDGKKILRSEENLYTGLLFLQFYVYF